MKLFAACALLLCLVIMTSSGASARDRIRTPNEVESRAAYCLAVLRDQKNSGLSLRYLDTIGDLNAERDADDDLRDNINRLQNFLSPRTRLVDAASLATAQMQGQKDSKELRRSFVGRDCKAKCGGDDVCVKECLEDDSLYRRVSQCDDLDFLPY